MSKTALIIVGDHQSGKSRLINDFLKPRLRMVPKQRLANIDGRLVCIKSQTLQEAGWSLDDLDRYRQFDIFVLTSWPDGHGTPSLTQIIERLQSLGFAVRQIPCARQADDNQCRAISREIAAVVER